jgi:hypothetical protein
MKLPSKLPANRHKPLLFVDVDGVISLFPVHPDTRPEGRWVMVDGIVHLVSTEAGRLLRELANDFELVWCTGWEEKADEYLTPALGLAGPLPHLAFARPAPGAPSRHWKLDAIEGCAGPDRAVAWIDDDQDESCVAWAERRVAPTLLVATDPRAGLTATEAARLRTWARALDQG